MRLLVLGLFVSLAASCSSGGPACNATTCQGCCDVHDQCQAGSAFDACGNGGTTCRACSAGETCALNFCTATSTGGGTGGGATGGGTGGGVMDAGTGGGGAMGGGTGGGATGGGTGGGVTGGGTGGGAMGGGSGTDAGMPPTVTVSTGNCGMVTPCASNLVGTWFYTAACADDPLADFRSLCAGITSVSSNSQLSGRVDFTATTVTRSVTTNYTSTVNLPASCASLGCATIESLLQNTAPGATCVAAGTGCNCTLSGSSTLNESGTWTESNGVITVTTSTTTRTFDGCVAAGTPDTLHLRETSTTSNTEKGTTTLTRQ